MYRKSRDCGPIGGKQAIVISQQESFCQNDLLKCKIDVLYHLPFYKSYNNFDKKYQIVYYQNIFKTFQFHFLIFQSINFYDCRFQRPYVSFPSFFYSKSICWANPIISGITAQRTAFPIMLLSAACRTKWAFYGLAQKTD